MHTLTLPKNNRTITRGFLATFFAFFMVAVTPIAANAAIYTGSGSISGSSTALTRANYSLTHQAEACGGSCTTKSLHVAAWIWGYKASGFASAKDHWAYLKSIGKAKVGRYDPPLGAVLYWNAGTYGFEAIYVGNGKAVGVWPGNYITKFDVNTVMPSYYAGWGYPVYIGPKY